jgi:hypothetical protein
MIEVDPDFLSFLKDEENKAFDGTLLDEVEAAINSYNGQPYGDEEDGRSQVVARDVSETTDYMLTSVLDAFVASGRVVEFEPSDEADEQTADDATEAMHYLYRRKSGYRLIHDWAKGGLLEKIAVVKSCVERKKRRHEAIYHPSMLPEHAIEAEPIDEVDEEGTPFFRAVTLEEMAAEFKDYYVPLEEFRVAPDARDLDSAVYLCHLTEKSLSDLVEMGLDPPDNLQDGGSSAELQSMQFARDDGRSVLSDDRKGALRKVWLREEYVLYDLNGDGLAERLCVHRVGNTILAVEEVDYQPFEYWCPYPMQGRLIGQSLADKTMDIQRVNTVVERLMLDSGYQQLQPGTFIHEDSIGDHTIDDLLTVRPGRLVRFTGTVEPIPEQRVDITATALQILDFKKRQSADRTGITQLNRGVDDDTLNDTAKGQAQLMSRGQQMERYIIRNFAEGVARLFMKKLGLMRKYGQPFQIRVDGEYRQVDPSQWPEDMEVQVKVGLGSGSKEDRIMGRQMIAQMQAMAVQGGLPIASPDNIYNNMTGLARDFGLQPNDLWTEPPKDEQGNPVPQEQPPDPEMMKAQAELQLKQQAHEGDMQIKAADLQAKQQEAALKTELERAKAQEAAQLARDKAEFEREQAIAQMMFEREIEMQRFEHEKKLAYYKADKDAEAKKYRDGGDLSK